MNPEIELRQISELGRIADALETPSKPPPMTGVSRAITEAFTSEVNPQHLIEAVNVTDMLFKIGEAVERQADASRMIAQSIERHAEEVRLLASALTPEQRVRSPRPL